MSLPLAKLTACAALLTLGGLGGAAITAGSDVERKPRATALATPAPAEVRTVVVRRTVHVYRKPKRRHIAPAAAAAPPSPVPVVARAPVATAPVHRSAPLETRTSGSGSGEREDGDDGHRESERDDD